ncbi:TolC family protein [Arcobacteraceae bacterium]|nr:TolC family protein [Arcobacteraceae bacterium]
MKLLLLTFLPLCLWGYTIDFNSSLLKTQEMNKGLKAKKLTILESKIDLDIAKGYDYGSLVFNENISKTNNAGYAFGMKLSSREATFADFGFADFLAHSPSPMDSSVLDVQSDDLNNPESRTNFETKLTYTLPIFTGFKLKNAKKMAKLQILAKIFQYKYDEKALSLEVLKAYNGAVTAKEFIKATKKAKEATSSFVNFAHELFNEGLVTSIDVKQAKVYDMGVDSEILKAANRYELAISYLRFLTSDNLISNVGFFKSIENEIINVKELQEKAYKNRDDFSSMKYNTQTIKSKIDMEKSDYFPKVGAQIEYGYNDDEFNNINDEHDYYMAAIGLSYNLFDGFITSAKKQKAQIEYQKMKHYYDYMKDGIGLEVEKNILTLLTKQKILNQKIKANNLSDEVLEQSQELYKNHLINMSNLLLQQANQQKANAEMILAKYEKSLAAGKLKISLGENLK